MNEFKLVLINEHTYSVVLMDSEKTGTVIVEVIRRKKMGGKWVYAVFSKIGKQLGDWSSRDKALKRLRQIEFHKRQGGK